MNPSTVNISSYSQNSYADVSVLNWGGQDAPFKMKRFLNDMPVVLF